MASLKMLIWNLAWSYNESDFSDRLHQIFVYDTTLYENVLKTNPKSWCRAFYKLGTYCEDVENNFVESFNASIVKAREKPLVPMLETIRRLAMVRINKRYVSALKHDGICTPYVSDFLETEHEKVADCRFLNSTNGMFEVLSGGNSQRVSLARRTCTCRKFDVCGIPCEHAYAAIIFKKLQPDDFVCHWFHSQMWRKTYESGLAPLQGQAFWPSTNFPDIHEPPPAAMPGRKKKTGKDKRKKGVNESPSKKKHQSTRVMHCRICKKANHNARFHKNDHLQENLQISQGESSQGVLTQLQLTDNE